MSELPDNALDTFCGELDKQEPERPMLYCSFCGKANSECGALISGPTAHICDTCVELCVEVIANRNISGSMK